MSKRDVKATLSKAGKTSGWCFLGTAKRGSQYTFPRCIVHKLALVFNLYVQVWTPPVHTVLMFHHGAFFLTKEEEENEQVR